MTIIYFGMGGTERLLRYLSGIRCSYTLGITGQTCRYDESLIGKEVKSMRSFL